MKNCFQERLSVNHSQQELLFRNKEKNRANELIISNKTSYSK
jgi:hypothetical protein